jgi:hypothetical protein
MSVSTGRVKTYLVAHFDALEMNMGQELPLPAVEGVVLRCVTMVSRNLRGRTNDSRAERLARLFQ